MKSAVFARFLLVLFAVICSSKLAAQSMPHSGNTAPGETATEKLRLMDTYGRLPLSFEANEGQTDPRVKFLSRGAGQTLFLTSSDAVLVLSKPQNQNGLSENTDAFRSNWASSAVLRMKLIGASKEVEVAGLKRLPGTTNYFIGDDPTRWRKNVPTYGEVRYSEIYPGIDLVYYGNQRQLEYDFVVAPGAEPTQIRLAIRGASKISIDANGSAVIQRKDGDVRLLRPRLYQEVRGEKIEIAGGYVLKGSELRFAIAPYDHSQELVIDPVLVYSTYLGGNGIDLARGIAVDASGNAYVAGYTGSTNFPSGSGPVQSIYGGGTYDVFVAKLDPTGSTLLYSTYLGGSGDDVANGIAVDSSGNAYVTGHTTSVNFPLSNPIQSTSGSGGDAFVAKLNAGGNALVYSTYLGGSGSDAATGIAVDSSGKAYVTGLTSSTDFPGVSANSFQPTNGGGGDAFVAELNATGTALVYSTYLGGSGTDSGLGIAIDFSGNAYVTGQTFSNDFPGVNSSSIQPASGGAGDAFVVKLNAAGTALVYSTYLGGSGIDFGLGIALDTSGNAYVTGYTNSSDFPGVTSNSIQAANAGGYDGFVAKLNATGTMLVYSTYLGGSGTDVAAGIAVDSSGNAYVTGGTTSGNFPAVISNSIQSTNGGLADAFVAELNAAGTSLVYSTYLGGSGNDTAAGIALDSSGNAYVAGYTGSTNFPLGSSPVQSTYGGGTYDAFIAKLSAASTGAATTTTIAASANPSVFGQQVSITATVSPTSSSPLTPAGNTTFNDGSTVLGTMSLTSGTATFNTSALAVGSHSLTASYASDSNFAPSTSTVLSQTVNQGTTTATVIASPNPGVAGQSVTLTATVTPVAPASGTPTGTMTFLDGSTSLGPGTLSGGQAIFTTSSLTAGSHSITATYSGDNSFLGNTSAATTLTVSQPLAITSLNQTVFTSGNTGSFTVTTTGFPSPSLSESGTLPVGVNFVDNGNGTATLSGTPGANAGGTYPITLTAHNRVDPNAAQNFTLIVNQPPAITSVNQTTFPLGTANSFSVVATGFPTPSISESGALPGGVTFNGATGALSGTPAAGTSGTYTITFVAHNSVGSDAVQSFMLTVRPSAAFTSVSLTTLTVGTTGSFTVTATGSPTPSLSEIGALPSGVTFNSGTGVLSGTPAPGMGGTYLITFTAHNGVGPDATQNFTLTVDQPSAISSFNQATFLLGTAGSFTIAATGFPTPSLSELGALPSGVSFVDNGNGTAALSGTPAAGAAGTYTITFTTHNGVGTDATQSFTLTAALIPTTTTIASSSNPSLSTRIVNFTVTISLGFPVGSLLGNSVLLFVDGQNTGSLVGPLSFTGSPNPIATVTLPVLFTPSGAHTVTAIFQPNSAYFNSSSASLTQTVNLNPATMILSSSSNPSLVNQDITITATLTSTVPIPSGFSTNSSAIAFQIDGGNVINVPPASAGGTTATAILPIGHGTLSPGPHTITAAYTCLPVSCILALSSGSLIQTVNNTPSGMQVAVSPPVGGTGLSPVSLLFNDVQQPGVTSLSISSSGAPPPTGFQLGNPPVYYNLSTTATFTGSVTFCINYSGIAFTQPPQLFHFQNGTWINITTSVDTNNMVVCGLTNSFSPFALFQPSVNPTTTAISAPGITYGTPASVTVSVSSSSATVTGAVTLSVDRGTAVSMPLSNGSATFNLGVLNAAIHTLSANFAAPVGFTSSAAAGSLTVTQAPITVTANPSARFYGAANPVFSANFSGFVNGDSNSVLTGLLNCGTTALTSSSVGTYPIVCAGLSSPNYAIRFVPGTLTVVPETTSLSVTISPSSITVGQSTTVTVTLTAPDMLMPIDPSVLASVSVTSPIVSDILTNNGACALAPAGIGMATCTVTLTAVEPNGRTLNASFPGTANLAASKNLANLIVTAPLESKMSCLKSDFRNVAVPGGSYLWLNSIFKIRDVNKQKVTITFFQSSVQFQYTDASKNLVTVNQALPDAKIVIDPSVSTASTMYDAVDNVWITTVPFDLDDATFLTGIPWLVPAGGIPADMEPVTWCGTFASDTAGVDMGWRWSAAAYSSFSGDNTVLGVKPMNTDHDNPPANRDNAGTPENFKVSVIPGARGKGGKNYTGSYSGSAEIE